MQPRSATSPEQGECLFVTCFHLELKKPKNPPAKGSIPNSSWLSDERFKPGLLLRPRLSTSLFHRFLTKSPLIKGTRFKIYT